MLPLVLAEAHVVPEAEGLLDTLWIMLAVPLVHCETVVEAEAQVLGDAVGEVPPEAV